MQTTTATKAGNAPDLLSRYPERAGEKTRTRLRSKTGSIVRTNRTCFTKHSTG